MDRMLKEKIVSNYLRGLSLNRLVLKYNIPKSTLYYNLNKFGIIRKVRKVRTLKNFGEFHIGIFIGLWAGDGSRYKDNNGTYRLKIHFDKENLEQIKFVKNIMDFLFGKMGFISKDGKRSVSLKFSSKFVYDFPQRYLLFNEGAPHAKSRSIQLETLKHSSEFLMGFLIGLALSDGHFGSTYVYSTVSEGLAKQVLQIMKKLGFNPTLGCQKRINKNWKPIYRLKLTRAETIKFLGSITKCGIRIPAGPPSKVA